MILAHGSYLYDDLNAIENIQFASALRGKSPTVQEITRALDYRQHRCLSGPQNSILFSRNEETARTREGVPHPTQSSFSG